MIMISGANEEELELASARMDIMLATNYTPDNPGPLAIIDKYYAKEIERLKKKLDCDLQWAKKYEELFEENNRLNNIIDELHSDLKTLWIVLWNMDTEMTGYQNKIFDKYYDEFHKEELKEGK